LDTGALQLTPAPTGSGMPALRRAGLAISTFLATASIYGLAFPVTAFLVAAGTLAGLLGMRAFIRAGMSFWGNIPFWLVGRRLHVSGRERIEQGRKYIVVANHASMLDIPALMAVIPDMALVGREKLLRIPLFGFFLRMIGYIPIDTENMRKAGRSMEHAIQTIRRGVTVGLFPEGTRTPTGRVQKLKHGFIRILRDTGLDVLPITILGTFALKPKHRATYCPRERIRLVIHEPLQNALLAGLSDHDIAEKVRTILDGPCGAPRAAEGMA
jgi:1-acyl-sn-glycerol-3-phosphate acyltransferase